MTPALFHEKGLTDCLDDNIYKTDEVIWIIIIKPCGKLMGKNGTFVIVACEILFKKCPKFGECHNIYLELY